MNPWTLGLALVTSSAIFSSPIVYSQTAHYDCGFGGEKNAEALARALSHDKTCAIAADHLSQCSWGSSADTEFAPIVISKCEKQFLNKLSSVGKERYGEEMQLCAYQYSRSEGTLAMSEAAMCQVNVATQYAAHPERAKLPTLRASFPCERAESPLEKAICSDVSVGHADIVLSKVYNATLSEAKGEDRKALITSERKWLAALPVQCGLGGSMQPELQHLCLRNQIEKRFTKLNCEEISDCIHSLDELDEQPSAPEERASFDCEKPSTPLQIVICADAELGEKDMKLAGLLKDESAKLDDAQRSELSINQTKWSQFVQESCPMGAIGGIPSWLTRACVGEAYERRIEQVQTCTQKPAKQHRACLAEFNLFHEQSDR